MFKLSSCCGLKLVELWRAPRSDRSLSKCVVTDESMERHKEEKEEKE